MAKHTATAVLLDLVDASRLSKRTSATKRILAALKAIEDGNAELSWAPLEVTRGDELAAVCPHPAHAVRLVRAFQVSCFPLDFRAVIAHGELEAGWDTRRASVIDGPAFARADESARAMKRSDRRWRLLLEEPFEALEAEALLELLHRAWLEMTDFQFKVAREALPGRKQREVAEAVKRSPQQISAALKSVGFTALQHAEAGLEHMLDRWDVLAGAPS